MYSNAGKHTGKRLGRKVAATTAAAAMIVASVPAVALAHYEYDNHTGKAVVLSESADSWDSNSSYKNGLKTENNADGTVSYTGIVHSDLAHYSGYGLTTKITTDKRGIVTAIDITSGNDTFAGTWGYKNSAKSVAAFEKVLPDGVDFDSSTNGNVITPKLTGASSYGTAKVVAVAGYSVDGKTAPQEPTTKTEGRTTTIAAYNDMVKDGVTYDEAAGTITVNSDSVNLVKIQYQIGGEKLYFNTYVGYGPNAEAADSAIDKIAATTWEDKPSLAGTMAETNRDRWTYIMATIYAQRMFASWNAALTNSSAKGELDDLDTVSGATKTADVFESSLNQAALDGKVKGVAENVKVTIDGSDINVTANPEDQSTVTKNASGQYVLTNVFPLVGNEKGGTHNVVLNKITLYKTGSQLTTSEIKEIAKGRGSQKGTEYTAESLGLNPTTATNARTGKETTSYSWGNYDGDQFALAYTSDDDITRGITVKDKDVNLVALTFTLGHNDFTLCYDLAQMKAAGDVKAQIAKLSSKSSASAVASARKAYNALSTDVRGFVSNISTLKKLEASKKANTMSVKTATKTVKLAKVKKAKQTVKAITVSKARGTVAYKKKSGSAKLSVNAKNGKVTVKKGTKRGTYSAKVTVKAAGTANYKSASKTVTVKVKVK